MPLCPGSSMWHGNQCGVKAMKKTYEKPQIHIKKSVPKKILMNVLNGKRQLSNPSASKAVAGLQGTEAHVTHQMNYTFHSYVKAVIVTETHQIQVYLGEELAETFDYQLTI
jgi:hypothetical protein